MAFLFILAIKLRKSPLIYLLRIMPIRISKRYYNGVFRHGFGDDRVAHWYENIIALGFIYLFFAFDPAAGARCAGGIFVHDSGG